MEIYISRLKTHQASSFSLSVKCSADWSVLVRLSQARMKPPAQSQAWLTLSCKMMSMCFVLAITCFVSVAWRHGKYLDIFLYCLSYEARYRH